MPSRDQAKLAIRPEVNLVSCWAGPPVRGCSQMLEAPFLVSTYWSAFPEGDQAQAARAERDLGDELQRSARGRNHPEFRGRDRSALLVRKRNPGAVG